MYTTVKVQAFSRQHECHHNGPGHHHFPWAGVGHRRLPLHPCHPTDARPQSHPMRWSQFPSDFTASPPKYPHRKTSYPPVTSRCHHPSADPPSPDPVRSKLGGRLMRPTYDLVNFFMQKLGVRLMRRFDLCAVIYGICYVNSVCYGSLAHLGPP